MRSPSEFWEFLSITTKIMNAKHKSTRKPHPTATNTTLSGNGNAFVSPASGVIWICPNPPSASGMDRSSSTVLLLEGSLDELGNEDGAALSSLLGSVLMTIDGLQEPFKHAMG